MTPNAENYKRDPQYLREMIKRAGISQRQAARLIGIDERLMRAYLADPSLKSAREAPYAVQFCLETLADNNTYRCMICGYDKGDDWLDDGETCPKCKLVQ